ncbi:MAG: hypothetical protein ACIAQF_06020 [Phycisphaerales bacterium JB065]
MAGVAIVGSDKKQAPEEKKPGNAENRKIVIGQKQNSKNGQEGKNSGKGGKEGVVSFQGPRMDGDSSSPVTYLSEMNDLQPQLIRKLLNQQEQALITPNLQKVWNPRGNDSLEPTNIEHHEVEDGFDLVFTFTNSGATPRRLGEVVIGGIRFPESIVTRAIFSDGKSIPLSHNNAPYFGGGKNYPGGLYSPVAILQNGDDTIGVSMLYDVREYRHDVFIRVESPGGIFTHGGRNWQVRFVFDRDDDDEGGRILPGQTRVYRVCVRAQKSDPSEWVRTLKPYRDFFRETYGPVRYERDPRPVVGMITAMPSIASVSNPRGFVGTADRPDLAGFEPIVEKLQEQVDKGFERVMIWSPSGVYRNNVQNNYPFNFTSGWNTVPALARSKHVLKEFGDSETDLGLWWGNSSNLMPRGWDAAYSVRFDPKYPFHVNRGREEMNGAVSVGATTVGLDAMSGMPAWNAYDWVLQLQSEYPQVRFVFETMAPDFIHTITPTYIYGTRIPETDPYGANNPHLLADFLNPGHEIWAQISGHDIKVNLGLPSHVPVPQAALYERAAQAANQGYVPMIFGPVPTTEGLDAAESWLYTIPEDLQD